MDQARQDSLEEVRPGDEDRVFYRLSVPKKLVVMLGGPTMNLLIAVVLLTGVATLYGVATAHPADQLGLAVRHACRPSARPRRPRARPRTPWRRRTRPGSGRATGSCPSAARRSAPGTRSGALVRPSGDSRWRWSSSGTARGSHLTATPIFTDVPVRRRPGQARARRAGTVRTERVGFIGVLSRRWSWSSQPVTAVPGIVGTAVGQTAGVDPAHPAEDGGRRPGRVRLGCARPERPDVGRRGRPGRRRGRRRPDRRPRRRRREQVRHPADAHRVAATSRCSSSTSSRCCRWTAGTSPARCGRASSAGSPGCAAGPTPATSTSPRRCRSPTRCPSR